MKQYKNTVNISTRITKTPTHTHTHTQIINPHTHTHYKLTHTHQHIKKPVKTTTVQDTHQMKQSQYSTVQHSTRSQGHTNAYGTFVPKSSHCALKGQCSNICSVAVMSQCCSNVTVLW
jgi:hypothetical protein